MLDLFEMYTLADPLFFEEPSRLTDGSRHALVVPAEFSVSALEPPTGWKRTRSGLWQVVTPENPALPEQGWKIHVSATVDGADATCRDVWDYCTGHGIPFKYLLDKSILVATNAKYAARASSGKLLTVYPRDEEELERTLHGLSALVGGRPGPYVLSDLRWDRGPLYVRYGAFQERWCLDAHGSRVPALRAPDGSLVPDRRVPSFSPPSWVELPDVLKPHLAARSSEERQPYVVEKALHFSNGGGIYLGRREEDGLQVVLKEARPHAGLDRDLRDAVARQEREEENLRRLDGVPGVPRFLGSFTLGGHRFLVEEYMEGRTLGSWGSIHHPGVTDARPGADSLAAFTERALRILGRLEAVLAAVHDRGLVFGDLHANNVIVDSEDNVALIDYELAFDADDDGRRAPLGAPGFSTSARTGPAVDAYALAATRLSVFLPFSRITALAPEKAVALLGVLRELFPVPPAWADEIERELVPDSRAPAQTPVTPRAVATGIRASATPERTDRLFPGDLQQFVSGGYGMAHGAAGVLWALDRAGQGRSQEHEAWLLAASRRLRSPRQGFYDGVAGLAYALDHLGHREEAADLLDRNAEEPVGGVSLFSGTAGVCANLAHFAAGDAGSEYAARAAELGGRLAEAVASASGGGPATGRAGLMRGWSGVALALLALYRTTGDTAWTDAAVRALHLDLDQCVTSPDGTLLVRDRGARALPNIDAGGLGVALVVQELLAHRSDERCAESLPALSRSCHTLLYAQADLLHGKAGQVAALARLGGAEEDLRSRVRELEWYALPFRGHTAFHGGRVPRLSMDLATGGAGILLALAAASGGGSPFLPFFSEPPATAGNGTG